MAKYHWYSALAKMAKDGIFNQQGLTPMKSAERANLYEALMYLAHQQAEIISMTA